MFKKILSAIGLGSAAPEQVTAVATSGYAPYREQACNVIYNLLFCDDLELFRKGENTKTEPWLTLLAEKPDSAVLKAIAEDRARESRLRILAYNRLREIGVIVPSGELLGVIIEVGLNEGLDVLAAFPDMRVRYINRAEGMSIFEGVTAEIDAKVKTLLAASQAVLHRIGPWNQPRMAPPPNGTVRMTFLVSDGLYFGQEPFSAMQNDEMAGPIIAASLDLLHAVVDKALDKDGATA